MIDQFFDETAYYEAINWLFQRSRGLGAHFELGCMERALKLPFLQSPHRQYPTIHVAGTNGKGSVSTKIARGLELQGYRVGLYTSPHISSLCERIQVNRIPISPSQFLEIFQRVRKIIPFDSLNLTFFEIVTLLAFQLFCDEKIDIAVFEAGLGGRLDATNVIDPILSIITSIGLDHVEQLGNSIEKITREKGGIIKPNVPVVIGPSVPIDIIESIAQEKMALLHIVSQKGMLYDAENSAIASCALQNLPSQFQATAAQIEEACQIRPPCRFERVTKNILNRSTYQAVSSFSQPLILDVAHNSDGVHQLCRMFEREYPGGKAVLLFSASREKDVVLMLQILSKQIGMLFVFPNIPSMPRLFSSEELYEQALRASIPKDQILQSASLEEALISYALPNAENRSIPIIVTGSFFIMGEIRSIVGYRDYTDSLFSNEASIRAKK
ncbi:MAG: Mur ligase family protein [Chlamydia sp.]